MRQIQEELGEADENAEVDELRAKVDASKMPDEVRTAARKQLSRMAGMATTRQEVPSQCHERRDPTNQTSFADAAAISEGPFT